MSELLFNTVFKLNRRRGDGVCGLQLIERLKAKLIYGSLHCIGSISAINCCDYFSGGPNLSQPFLFELRSRSRSFACQWGCNKKKPQTLIDFVSR